MAKRNFAALVAILLLGPGTHSARAESVSITVDGCAELARVVYSEVSGAALYGPGKSGPWVIDSGQGDVSVCSHTAKTVSRAFTSAMTSAGFPVVWFEGFDPGDYCLSHYLSECYPNRFPIDGSGFDANTLFVQKSWSVVSQSVMRHMHNPFSSDEIRFRNNDLKLRLGLSLRTVSTIESN